MRNWIRVVPLVLGIFGATALAGSAQAQALHPAVAAAQTNLGLACAVDGANVLTDREACLAEIALVIQTAATLPNNLQGQIGVIIGDLMETQSSLVDDVTALIISSGLASLSAGVQLGVNNPGVTNPTSFSPA